ncbi:MAG: MFS transporter [Anaerolineae bacterium]|nr:MFS transporter [Anaerolineae bacterium]
MARKGMKAFNYAIGMFGTSIPINLLKTFAAAYYVKDLGLRAEQWASVLFVYTFIDAIDNPVYGYLSDRTRTRWGRRKPWLVIGTPLLVLGLIAFYSTPNLPVGTPLLAYAMFFYIFTGTLDSVINANYAALFPELFPDDVSRAKTNAMRQAFQLVAMIISIALTPVVTNAIGFSMTAFIYGLLGGGVILYMALTAEERRLPPDEERPKLWESVKALVTNWKFWIAGLANAFYSASMSLVLAALPFYAEYALGISALQQTLLFATVLLIAIGSVVVWARLTREYTLMPTWRAALATLTVAFIPLYFARSFTAAILCSAFIGFGLAGVITTMDLVHARIMDEDQRKHNVRREGIIANALGFMNRLNGLFTSAAFVLVARIFLFESGDNPGPHPDRASLFLLTVFPFVLSSFSLLFSFFLHFRDMPTPEAAPEVALSKATHPTPEE